VGFFAPASDTALRETPKGASFSHRRGSPASRRPFLCAPYVAAEDGGLRPVRGIDRCPQAGEQSCRLAKRGWRRRKTGPAFPVQVVRCRTHGAYFTVYPQGHTPYGRQRLTPAGAAVDSGAADDVKNRWAGTIFEAAVQAAAGMIGVRDAGFEDGPSLPRHSTQRRRVSSAARLLALSLEIDERLADAVSQVLDLPGLDHRQARTEFASAAQLRERGRVIVSVLERMPLAGALEQRLLCSGFLVGLWGRPVLWDARTSRRVFPPCGTTPWISPRSPPLARHENVPYPAQGRPSTLPSS